MPQQMANDGKEMPTYVIGRGYRAIFHLALVSSRYLRAASLFAWLPTCCYGRARPSLACWAAARDHALRSWDIDQPTAILLPAGCLGKN